VQQESEGWMDLGWTARRLGRCETTVRRLGDRGAIPVRRLPNGKRQFWLPAVERLAAERMRELAGAVETMRRTT
jgi:hypothetical protein